ncbi:MFS transporter [Nocardia terpenica]|uniref:MFS transporter n=1 Tax=Nocardia terpenica TaxID=455432 RepID=A0A291RNH8_9NOCA|nr:MFS transporter [Nocardia terpenica]ATL68819.1 MFS transporter [Nocardia terpenica]
MNMTVNAATRSTRSSALVLAVLCVCVIVINMDTMIVNVALPDLVEQLHASTRDLQWVADAFNLVFAALVIAAGSLSDRFGRRGALIFGLAVFTLASGLGAFSGTTVQLILARAVMGVGAAFIYPTTLSILTTVFVGRKERAAAIGIWGACSGLGMVLGPLVGGALLQEFWWGSIFLVMAPVGLVALVSTAAIVPTSRDPETPDLDKSGLILSCLAFGTLVYTIIEAPRLGWGSGRVIVGFLVAAALFVALYVREIKARSPMLDVRLFRDARFSAACGAMTTATFTLMGLIFLCMQYLQFLKHYTPIQTGLRFTPVAIGMVLGSMLGGKLAVQWGSRMVITSGLGVLTALYVWFTIEADDTSSPVLAAQMALVGLGLGAVGVPATDAIMRAVPPAKASVGSAMNDATRLLGGTLGIAVVGSLFQSLYTQRLIGSGLPHETLAGARDSIGNALSESARYTGTGQPGLAERLLHTAQSSFYHGFHGSCWTIAALTAMAVVVAWFWLPADKPQAAD